MQPEILDVVDGFDRIVGTIDRAEYASLFEQPDRYIRAAEMFIMNHQGELWTPIRTAAKKIAPNGYDYSSAGHVEHGEDYLMTIIRETKEELNLTITEQDIEYVCTLKSGRTRYIRSIYLLRSNEAPDYNHDDFTSAEWLTPQELITAIGTGHPAKSSLISSINALVGYLDEH